MDAKPKYHDVDLPGAIRRAKGLKRGMVIRSTAPGTESPRDPGAKWGYWSEAGGNMIRLWERIVWSHDET